MYQKIRVGIIFGGKSAEHEVSLQSAKNIIEALDRDKYDLTLIGIDKQGRWHLNEATEYLLEEQSPRLIKLNQAGEQVTLAPGSGETGLISLSSPRPLPALDVIFPVLHGPCGEDGTIQGFLKLVDTPFVGAGVVGSAVGMDKDVFKRLLRDAGIPQARFMTLHSRNPLEFKTVVQELGLPFFLKPANMGSSVGVHKVKSETDFASALKDAFQYDRKVIAEEFIEGRELECSVLGNDDPIASLPGEVLPTHEFYSYEAKYIDENGAALKVPAQVSEDIGKQVQTLAIQTFLATECQGMARVDMFLKPDGSLLVNEINTIPGFTRISMYPKLWEASGIPCRELLDRLIQLAIERHAQEKALKTQFDLP